MTMWQERKRQADRPIVLPPLASLPPRATAAAPDAATAAPAIDEVRAADREREQRPAERWRQLTQIAALLAAGDAAARTAIRAGAYPPEGWDVFRRDVPIRPPPATPRDAEQRLTIVIDARRAAPFLLRATLRGLQDQSLRDWRALVAVTDDLFDHPVASFVTTDPRIGFVAPDAIAGALGDTTAVVMIDGGTLLDPEALAWLVFAAARTGAPIVFADHDHGILDPALGPIRADPMLYGCRDRGLIAELGPPAIVLASRASLGAGAMPDAAMRNDAMLTASRVAHVPRALATRLALPLVARAGRASADDSVAGRLGPIIAAPPPRGAPPPRDDRIAIVIPTRDGADLLARAIDTLRATARDAARLDIVVVDNRSADEETRGLIAHLAAVGAARTIAFDAPFNWSLASNLGARASDAPVIAFVNNDIEMLSHGWDDRLLGVLADPQIGAVGARLLYPDSTIQHAGVAFGFGPGGAEHEGRNVAGDAPGPGRRYLTTHDVASVTGAFLAVRRADFEAVEGFDAARLMIAHSDVDLCLRLRERDLTIVYCAAIEAIHHEGATRGRNETRAAIAWDEGERADLIARWGEELGEDPGINPYWTRGGQPFETLREPGMSEIVRHIDRSAGPAPWRPTRDAARTAAAWAPAPFGGPVEQDRDLAATS